LTHRTSVFPGLIAAGSLLLVGPATARPARADTAGDTIRTLSDKYQAAVVTLTVVVRAAGGGADETSDSELNVSGFIVDPSGLVVTTDSAIDPAGMMSGLMPDAARKFTTKVVSAKIVMGDGTSVPAQVVLRDSDRNIAFVRPSSPLAAPAVFVDLQAGQAARIGDPIYLMARLGKAGNRAPSVTESRIISIIEHPRTLYVPATSGMNGLGDVAFNEQGAPLGLVSIRFSAGGMSRSFNMSDSILPIIVPAADVLEEAKQALTAKAIATPTPEPKKSAEPPPAPMKKPKAHS
jgi:hypothetical protein